MLEPLVKTIDVPCDQEMAFTVFMDMGAWWPTSRFATSVMRGDSVKDILVDAAEGGKIVELASDGREHTWGVIRTYEPFALLEMDFHVPHPSETDPGFSNVQVRFDPLENGHTRVELVQSNWEGLGDVAEMVRGGYGQGWVMIFEGAFKAACEATTADPS